jgi:carbonic anhydrase
VPTPELQARLTPHQVLERLRDGNQRFADGTPRDRDARGRVKATAERQSPLAVVLACSDSRVPTEILFDVGVGEIFSIRIAGNVSSEEALGSMEFGCAVTKAKLLLVLGHTSCGAVSATIDLVAKGETAVPEYEHLGSITRPLAEVVAAENETASDRSSENDAFVKRVTELNVRRTMEQIPKRSVTLRGLIEQGKLELAGGVYDVATGRVQFLETGDQS